MKATRWLLVALTLAPLIALSLRNGSAQSPQTPPPVTKPNGPGKDEKDRFPVVGDISDEHILPLLPAPVTVIDLASALNLAGVRNPQMLMARERIVEATALRQIAAAQFLPSLHAGTSFDNHNGNLLLSDGTVVQTSRQSYYIGAGAGVASAGTLTVPGVAWNFNVSDTIYKTLEARQVVKRQVLAQRAVENVTLLRVALAYLELVRAEGHRTLSLQTLADAGVMARLTKNWADSKVGLGRQSDAFRARTEYLHCETFFRQTEGEVAIASARLAELLDLPPVPRLHPLESKAVPSPAVPDQIPLAELLTIAVMNRPELQEQQTAIRQTMFTLDRTRTLPFSPTVLIGFSYGGFGGGSDLAAQPVGTTPFAAGETRASTPVQRSDLDAVMYWSLQNLGAGNLAMIKEARAGVASANLELVRRLNDVRAEVAGSQARTQARLARIDVCAKALDAIVQGFAADLRAIRGGEGLPIELENSLRLMGRARLAYLDAIVDYNEAQMQLFVALGQPPVDSLIRPVPATLRKP